MEKWKTIDGFEKYEVSDCGSVRSLDQLAKGRWGNDRKVKGRTLKQQPMNGYRIVTLSLKSKRLVSRLVAAAFIPNPLGKPEVNHKDGDRSNNHASNLEWCTRSENLIHSFRVLGRPSTAKPVNQRTIGGSFIKRFKSATEASIETEVGGTGIGRCCRGESKQSGGYKWEFARD